MLRSMDHIVFFRFKIEPPGLWPGGNQDEFWTMKTVLEPSRPPESGRRRGSNESGRRGWGIPLLPIGGIPLITGFRGE